jgi:hypothetical protein
MTAQDFIDCSKQKPVEYVAMFERAVMYCFSYQFNMAFLKYFT